MGAVWLEDWGCSGCYEREYSGLETKQALSGTQRADGIKTKEKHCQHADWRVIEQTQTRDEQKWGRLLTVQSNRYCVYLVWVVVVWLMMSRPGGFGMWRLSNERRSGSAIVGGGSKSDPSGDRGRRGCCSWI